MSGRGGERLGAITIVSYLLLYHVHDDSIRVLCVFVPLSLYRPGVVLVFFVVQCVCCPFTCLSFRANGEESELICRFCICV